MRIVFLLPAFACLVCTSCTNKRQTYQPQAKPDTIIARSTASPSPKDAITISNLPGQDKTNPLSPERIWTEAYDLVEEMPQFPGGNEALRNYLATELRYPPSAAEKGIEGKVIVRFIVLPDGHIGPVHVDDSALQADPELEKEAVRLIAEMPRWTPGRHHGKEVAVKCVIPVEFKLPVIDINEAEQEKLSAQLEELRKRLDATTDIPLRINVFGNGREGQTLRIDLIRNTPEWQKRFREQIMDSPALRFDGPDGQEPCELDGAAQIGEVRLVPQQNAFPTSSQEAHFILHNQSEDTISYGSDYYLAYEKDGQWYYLPTERLFNMLKISLLPNGQTTFSANLYPEVNENQPGRYRFFKEVEINGRKEMMMAEFSLHK